MKYEFTRDEICQWLKEQNWECKKLEEILLAPADKPKEEYKPIFSQKVKLDDGSVAVFNYPGGMKIIEPTPSETDKPKRAVNKDNVHEFVDLYNGKNEPVEDEYNHRPFQYPYGTPSQLSSDKVSRSLPNTKNKASHSSKQGSEFCSPTNDVRPIDKSKEKCDHKYDPYTNICDYCHRPKKEKSEVKTKPEKIESTMDSAEQGSLGSHAIYINEAIEKINEIIDFLSTKDKE